VPENNTQIIVSLNDISRTLSSAIVLMITLMAHCLRSSKVITTVAGFSEITRVKKCSHVFLKRLRRVFCEIRDGDSQNSLLCFNNLKVVIRTVIRERFIVSVNIKQRHSK